MVMVVRVCYPTISERRKLRGLAFRDRNLKRGQQFILTLEHAAC